MNLFLIGLVIYLIIGAFFAGMVFFGCKFLDGASTSGALTEGIKYGMAWLPLIIWEFKNWK